MVDHGTSLELQEANSRLRERLTRMVQHINKAKKHTDVHTHALKSKQTYCTGIKEMAAHTVSIFNRQI